MNLKKEKKQFRNTAEYKEAMDLWEKSKELKKTKKEIKELESKAKDLFHSARTIVGYYKTSSSKNGRSNSIEQFGYRDVRKSWIKDHSMAKVACTLSERAFEATAKGGKVKFCGRRKPLTSFTDRNKSVIKLKNGRVWIGRSLYLTPIIKETDVKTSWLLEDKCEYKFIEIVRKKIKGRWRYYAHFTCEGVPRKNPNQKLGKGIVGIDLGPSTIAYVSDASAKLQEFCKEIDYYETKIRLLSRQIDRQRRKNNPDNFNANGTAKRGCKWTNSNRYLRNINKLADFKRKEAEYRRCLHGFLTNEIRAEGDVAKLEKLCYTEWQMNKRFSRSVMKKAPGFFVELLKKKFEATDGKFVEIDPYEAKLSQTCICGNVKKKELKDRIHYCEECGYEMQRDLHSAFLAKHIDVQADELEKVCQGQGRVLRAACKETSESAIGSFRGSSFGTKSELERIACNDVEHPNDDTPLANLPEEWKV